jgi:hypothetical protein
MPLILVVWSARPIQPLMRTLVRPQGEIPGRIGRKIAGAEADQRIVGREGGHHHLADFAPRHRVAGAGTHDLDDHAFVDDEALRASVS